MFEKIKTVKTRATQGFTGGQPLESKKAFTLAETLITLTILGVVAAITVPMLINKQMEAANRTKLKKAMAAYEKALNQMIIDNDIKSDLSALNGSECATTRPYFKTVENGDNNCSFKTADRIWWDITDIEKPIISFKKENLTAANAGDSATKKAFYLLGRRDTNGTLRIDDKGYEDSITNGNTDNQKYMAKLYDYINSKATSSNAQVANVQEPEPTPEPTVRSFYDVKADFNSGKITMKQMLQELSQNEDVTINYGSGCADISANSYMTPVAAIFDQPAWAAYCTVRITVKDAGYLEYTCSDSNYINCSVSGSSGGHSGGSAN